MLRKLGEGEGGQIAQKIAVRGFSGFVVKVVQRLSDILDLSVQSHALESFVKHFCPWIPASLSKRDTKVGAQCWYDDSMCIQVGHQGLKAGIRAAECLRIIMHCDGLPGGHQVIDCRVGSKEAASTWHARKLRVR